MISTRSRTGRIHLSGLITVLILLSRINDSIPDPITFSQYWNNERITERKLWREAIRDEMVCMKEKGMVTIM